MLILIVSALALAVVAGFWYSYYQSLEKLRAHDRETVRLMEQDLDRLTSASAPLDAVEASRRKLEEFRTKHNVR